MDDTAHRHFYTWHILGADQKKCSLWGREYKWYRAEKKRFHISKKKKLFPNWSTGLEVKSSVDEYNTSVPNPDNLREHDLDLYLTLQPNT